MLSLQEDESVVIAAARVKDVISGETIIPFCFKIAKEKIPTDIKPYKLSPKNTVLVSFEDVKPINAMIIAVGDDSLEVDVLYKNFLEKSKKLNAQKKINIWLSASSITFTRTFSNGLSSVSRSDFENFTKRAGQKKPKKIQAPTPIDEVVTIDSGDEYDEDSFNMPGPSSYSCVKKIQIKIEKDSKPTFKHVKEMANELNQSAQFPVTDTNIRNFQVKMSRAFDILVNYLEAHEDIICPKSDIKFEKSNNYYIPSFDRTYEKGSFTYIEGLLPISTRKYKSAMKSLPTKMDDLDPTIIVTAIVKFTFPTHWIIDVTLRGAGKRKSLVNIWNYHNPSVNPCMGVFENGLGVSRLRALLDHAVRKTGKLSYDILSERALYASIAKSMHYVRDQLAKKASEKSYEESSGFDDHESLDDFVSDHEPPQDSSESDIRITRNRSRTRVISQSNILDNFGEDDSDSSASKQVTEKVHKKQIEPAAKKSGINQSFSSIFNDLCQSSTTPASASTTATAIDPCSSNATSTSAINSELNTSRVSSTKTNLAKKRSKSVWESLCNKRVKSSVDAIRSVIMPTAIQEPQINLKLIPDVSFDDDDDLNQFKETGNENSNSLNFDVGHRKEKDIIGDKVDDSSSCDKEKNDNKSVDEEKNEIVYDEEEAEASDKEFDGNEDEDDNLSDEDDGNESIPEENQDSDEGEKEQREDEQDPILDDEEKREGDSGATMNQALSTLNNDDSTTLSVPSCEKTTMEQESLKVVNLHEMFSSNPVKTLIYIKENGLMEKFMADLEAKKNR